MSLSSSRALSYLHGHILSSLDIFFTFDLFLASTSTLHCDYFFLFFARHLTWPPFHLYALPVSEELFLFIITPVIEKES